ncbi:MAG: hypothetical protein JXM70_10450 [Pirellulales bacterium]|nr:hypothetical protein [Pirellulales bacterium]
MARKIQNRIQLREEAEAAERLEESAPKKKKKKAKATKRKSRAKVVKEVRLKAFWGVFNQSLRRVALFEYDQRDEADQKAEALGKSQKTPHFVQLVKEVIEE